MFWNQNVWDLQLFSSFLRLFWLFRSLEVAYEFQDDFSYFCEKFYWDFDKDCTEKSYEKPRQHIKRQRYHFADKGPHSQSYGFSRSWWWTGRSGMVQSMGSQRVRHDWATELNGFSSSHVWLWELDHKASIAPKEISIFYTFQCMSLSLP